MNDQELPRIEALLRVVDLTARCVGDHKVLGAIRAAALRRLADLVDGDPELAQLRDQA